ncbi:unnamed protein product [Hymenolepis diminuta]|uniref:Uncharacterized protein n=1 Tax=Hymenolepis diminuta TaxID=6216 RepID=A0A564ZC66_HYMDI|nr:unnamed protein product [Hymenolepis diminuta]
MAGLLSSFFSILAILAILNCQPVATYSHENDNSSESPDALVPSHSIDEQDAGVWKVGNSTQSSFFNHGRQERPPGRKEQLLFHLLLS